MSKTAKIQVGKSSEVIETPKYFPNAKIKCACGNVFEVGSTVEEINVDVCSACHPFYTGTQKFIDTAGRVDRFQDKLAKAKVLKQDIAKRIEIKNQKIKELAEIQAKQNTDAQ